jgi:transcriptional regulator with XRE-family HTH domain
MRSQMIEIGKLIKQRRELLGLLQPQLAGISGIGLRTLQLVEAGKANPSLETLVQIIDPLGLELNLGLKDLSKPVRNK